EHATGKLDRHRSGQTARRRDVLLRPMTLARKARSLLAISMGDPAGIGAEIILKSAAQIAVRRRAPSVVVVGDLRVVTATISKEWWHRAGHRYPGHSELVAEIGGVRRWRMMFAGDELKLALVTAHMGLKGVSAALTRRAVLETIRLLEAHLRERLGLARPRIGVLGFNPHAGENGIFGEEEIRAIAPAIRAAQR